MCRRFPCDASKPFEQRLVHILRMFIIVQWRSLYRRLLLQQQGNTLSVVSTTKTTDATKAAASIRAAVANGSLPAALKQLGLTYVPGSLNSDVRLPCRRHHSNAALPATGKRRRRKKLLTSINNCALASD